MQKSSDTTPNNSQLNAQTRVKVVRQGSHTKRADSLNLSSDSANHEHRNRSQNNQDENDRDVNKDTSYKRMEAELKQ